MDRFPNSRYRQHVHHEDPNLANQPPAHPLEGAISNARFMKPGQILEYLTRHPDHALQIDDALESKAFLANLELINASRKTDGPNLAIICSPQLQTHWVVGSCWRGFPEGDSYLVLFLPKMKVTEANLEKFVDELIEVQGGADLQRGALRLVGDWPKLN